MFDIDDLQMMPEEPVASGFGIPDYFATKCGPDYTCDYTCGQETCVRSCAGQWTCGKTT